MYYSVPSFKQDLLSTASNHGRSATIELLDHRLGTSNRPDSNHIVTRANGNSGNAQGTEQDQQGESITGMLNNFSKALGKC